MLASFWLVNVLVATLSGSPTEVDQMHEQARAKIRNVEYELAVPILEQALTANLEPTQVAEINADLGICYASLGNTESARVAFQRALEANVLLDLPVGTSPKIRQLFETVRAQGVQSARKSAQKTVAKPFEPFFDLKNIKTIDLALGGAAVVGLATGIISGIISSNAADDLKEGQHDRTTVDNLVSRQSNFGIISVCAYGIAGAAALSEVAVILFMDRGSKPAKAISAQGFISATGDAYAGVNVRF
jgi:hypothetical protein